MKTIIVKIDKDNLKDDFAVSQLEKAGEIIRNGGLVAFPTETVYGLGANALDEEAAKKVYEAKGRPSDNPLIVHISNLNMLDDIVTQVPEVAKSSMPISSKPRAMPTISCLSSSLTVMMIRPPRLGAFRPAPLKAFSRA